jgi:hypothetical protein
MVWRPRDGMQQSGVSGVRAGLLVAWRSFLHGHAEMRAGFTGSPALNPDFCILPWVKAAVCAYPSRHVLLIGVCHVLFSRTCPRISTPEN